MINIIDIIIFVLGICIGILISRLVDEIIYMQKRGE